MHCLLLRGHFGKPIRREILNSILQTIYIICAPIHPNSYFCIQISSVESGTNATRTFCFWNGDSLKRGPDSQTVKNPLIPGLNNSLFCLNEWDRKSEEKISIKDLPYALTNVTFENNLFVHSKVETGFHPREELEKMFADYTKK